MGQNSSVPFSVIGTGVASLFAGSVGSAIGTGVAYPLDGKFSSHLLINLRLQKTKTSSICFPFFNVSLKN